MKELFRRPQLRHLAAVVILYFLLGSLIDTLFFVIFGEESCRSHMMLFMGIRDLIIFAAFYFGLYYRKSIYWKPFGEREPLLRFGTILTIVGTAGWIIVLNVALTVAVSMMELDIVQETEDLIYAQSIPIQILSTVIAAPLLEETMCRGVIQGSFFALLPEEYSERKRSWIAVLFTAFIFGIFHAGWMAKLFAFAIGIVFGRLMCRYHDLRACILTHALTNLFAVVVQNAFL